MQEKSSFTSFVASWFQRNFSDPEITSLLVTLLLAVVVLECFGRLLTPILISVVFAYLLLSGVRFLKRMHFPRLIAVWLIFLVFLAVIGLALFFLLPALWKQLSNLSKQLPSLVNHGVTWFNYLKTSYPNLLTNINSDSMLVNFQTQISSLGQWLFSYSLTSIAGIIEFILYFILVPVMAFFFLKDSAIITKWMTRFLPTHRSVLDRVWKEVNQQIGNYVRGRVIEIVVVGVVSVAVFSVLNLQYALLLGALVGVSVIVPYVGAIVVTIPIVAIALFQWGMSIQFVYLMIAYAVIIILDANVLVPILFAETMDLHPIVIIISVLFFGGIWGFWGVFFAIPLATVIKAVINVWPKRAH